MLSTRAIPHLLTVFLVFGCASESEESAPGAAPLREEQTELSNPPERTSQAERSTEGPAVLADEAIGQLGSPKLRAEGERFVAAFHGYEGLYVVDGGGVTLFSREESPLAQWKSRRSINTAAFDGELLVMVDEAAMVTLDKYLNEIGQWNMAENCDYTVLVTRDRLVCVQSGGSRQLFRTYDARSGALLATSSPSRGGPQPLHHVPGGDMFITANSQQMELYRVSRRTNMVEHIVRWHRGSGSPSGTPVGFLGLPVASHIVDEHGAMFRIGERECAQGAAADSSCFARDGNLGTLENREARYLAVAEGPDGVYALQALSPRDGYYPCATGDCVLQRVNVWARETESSIGVQAKVKGTFSIVTDPLGTGTLVVASQGSSRQSYSIQHYSFSNDPIAYAQNVSKPIANPTPQDVAARNTGAVVTGQRSPEREEQREAERNRLDLALQAEKERAQKEKAVRAARREAERRREEQAQRSSLVRRTREVNEDQQRARAAELAGWHGKFSSQVRQFLLADKSLSAKLRKVPFDELGSECSKFRSTITALSKADLASPDPRINAMIATTFGGYLAAADHCDGSGSGFFAFERQLRSAHSSLGTLNGELGKLGLGSVP